MAFTAFGAVYKAAASLLPASMDTPAAWAMLYAIGSQESRLDARRQIGGPARGFWQFEFSGIKGILNHPVSKPLIHAVLDRLDYDYLPDTSYTAIEHNDVLAFAYARCLLYTLPASLPLKGETQKAWGQYIEGWRPGAPKPLTWPVNFDAAWIAVEKKLA